MHNKRSAHPLVKSYASHSPIDIPVGLFLYYRTHLIILLDKLNLSASLVLQYNPLIVDQQSIYRLSKMHSAG